jgi:spore maturation protein CgeB
MKIVIFGLTISSSWGNGHATLWRGLCGALARRGHDIVFFERDASWYAGARDLTQMPGGGELIIYPDWESVLPVARSHVQSSDAVIVTSYCADAIRASELVLESSVPRRVFYDLDTSVTLARMAAGEQVEYVGPDGYRGFDLVLSYTGGSTLDKLRSVLGAENAAPLYGSVDPETHFPAASADELQSTLSYMGTWSADRDEALRMRFIEPARRLTGDRFLIGGSKYTSDFDWLPNIYFVSHVPPSRHPAFFCSSRLTLNVTRAPMAALGYCPSGRLFEAAACGVPILSDNWAGLDTFYEPGLEILVANNVDEAMEAITRDSGALAQIGRAARERTLDCHTAAIRARELEELLESVAPGSEVVGASICGA